MSIVIYTYCNPYKLQQESFWNEIRSCPYFCASQTLVNGLKELYPLDFRQGRMTTVQNLIESAYEEWESTGCAVKQYAALDNIIAELVSTSEELSDSETVFRALQFNRSEIFNSIRTLFELHIEPENVLSERLSQSQKLLMKIYGQICNSEAKQAFVLPDDMSEGKVESIISEALHNGSENYDVNAAHMDRIVIHGVHQFTPIMLHTIEAVARYKKVILLFNYQTQYHSLCQTWIDIYSAFDRPIVISDRAQFRPDSQLHSSYAGNLLADNLGKMMEGNIAGISRDVACEILEFDNITEFANYAADLFEEAERVSPDFPMSAMREQIYSADASVNNILKIYFPEQFGERQFLNYPLGRFFVAIANMWDAEKSCLIVSDFNDIRECLGSGIIQEEMRGELCELFSHAESLLTGCVSINDMIARLNRVKKLRKLASDETNERLKRLAYYQMTDSQIDNLIHALEEVNHLAAYFYEDFERQPHNFRRFYSRLKEYLQNDILDQRELDEAFEDIVKRVLERLDEVADIEANASFDCLRATMNVYLVQQRKKGRSANWIVRPFEQLEGDILRSQSVSQRERTVYHFACLSDEDLFASKQPLFSWPLDSNFFEHALLNMNWLEQVYVCSRKEYKNYKRYALIQALEFNRSGYKLSYVRRKGEDERDFFYLLKLCGAKKTRFQEHKVAGRQISTLTPSLPEPAELPYTDSDLCRYRLCPYRFLLETLAEGGTVYKDTFLQLKYMEVWLGNRCMEELQGLPYSAIGADERLNGTFEELKLYFPCITHADSVDIIGGVRKNLSGKRFFPKLNDAQRRQNLLREDFLRLRLSEKNARKSWLDEVFAPASLRETDAALSSDRLSSGYWNMNISRMCQYCANKDLCVEYYASVGVVEV